MFFSLVLLAVCAATGPLMALSVEESAAEAVQKTREDTRAGRRFGDSCVSETCLRGRLYALPDAMRGNAEVLGVLAVKGRAYQLKAGDDALRREILRRIGHEVWLEGEVRNEGKYFIARRFAAALPPTVALRDRKGL
jgi:hypothetical protein